jgi:hypothetical protein
MIRSADDGSMASRTRTFALQRTALRAVHRGVSALAGRVPPCRQVTYQAETQMRQDGSSETEIMEAWAYLDQKWAVARAGGEGWDALQVATEHARGKRWAERVQLAERPEDIVPSWKLQMSYEPVPALERLQCLSWHLRRTGYAHSGRGDDLQLPQGSEQGREQELHDQGAPRCGLRPARLAQTRRCASLACACPRIPGDHDPLDRAEPLRRSVK